MPKPPRPGAFRALSHWDFEFASDLGRVSDLRWQAPHPSTRARDCHIEAVQPNRRVRGFYHIRRQCGSLAFSDCRFLPCQEPLLLLPVSRGISPRRARIPMGMNIPARWQRPRLTLRNLWGLMGRAKATAWTLHRSDGPGNRSAGGLTERLTRAARRVACRSASQGLSPPDPICGTLWADSFLRSIA